MSVPGKPLGLVLPRPSWLAAAAFSLAVHGGVAALFLRDDPSAPAAGSAVPIEVVIVEGPDVLTAASPAAEAAPTATADAREAMAAPAASAPEEADAAPEEAEAAPEETKLAPEKAEAAPEETKAAPEKAEAAPEEAEATQREAEATQREAEATQREAEATQMEGPAPVAQAAPAARPAPPAAKASKAPASRVRPEARPDTADTGGEDGAPAAQVAASRGAAPLGGNPKPVYPRGARLRGQEGRVVLRVEVLASGEAGAVTVAVSSGHDALDRAARDALRHWRFRPALTAGQPVGAVLDVPVRFRLDGERGRASR